MTRGFPLMLGAAIGIVTACRPSPDATPVERIDSAGVEIVWSPGLDRPLDLTSRLLFTLGGADDGPESFYRVAVGLVDTDADGHLYVLNGASTQVVVFDSTGSFLRAMGSEGPGPGELEFPGMMSVAANGTVSVFDYAKASLVRYDTDGQTLAPMKLSDFPTPTRQRHVSSNAERTIVATTDFSHAEEGPAYVLRRLTTADTVALRTIALPPPQMAMFPSCGGGLNLPPIFSPELVWHAMGERTAVNATPDYVIDVFEGKRLVRSVRRRLNRIVATEAMAVAELGDGFQIDFGRGPCTIPPAEMVDKRGFADTVQWIVGVTMNTAGELWVLRRDAANAERVIDVFDADGAYRGTWPDAALHPLAFLSAGRIATVVRDSLDVERVVVYQVTYQD